MTEAKISLYDILKELIKDESVKVENYTEDTRILFSYKGELNAMLEHHAPSTLKIRIEYDRARLQVYYKEEIDLNDFADAEDVAKYVKDTIEAIAKGIEVMEKELVG